MTLAEWVKLTSGEPFVPGVSECAGWAIRWVGIQRKVNVSRWFPSTGEEPAAFVERHGGLLALAEAAAADLGLARTMAPRAGHVGVLRARGVICAAVASETAGRWAVKGKRSVVLLEPEAVLAAWEV